MDTSGGLLGDTNEVISHLGPLLGQTSCETLSDDSHDLFELEVIELVWIWHLTGLGEVSLGLVTFVDEESGITTIINEHVWAIAVWPCEHLVGQVPVLLEGLTLPGEDVGGLSGNDGGSGVILCGVDVARSPSHFGTEGSESLDEDSSLNGHME